MRAPCGSVLDSRYQRRSLLDAPDRLCLIDHADDDPSSSPMRPPGNATKGVAAPNRICPLGGMGVSGARAESVRVASADSDLRSGWPRPSPDRWGRAFDLCRRRCLPVCLLQVVADDVLADLEAVSGPRCRRVAEVEPDQDTGVGILSGCLREPVE